MCLDLIPVTFRRCIRNYCAACSMSEWQLYEMQCHPYESCMCLQGVICFESLMEEGRKRGTVTDNKPIICKPNKVVCTYTLSS